MTEREAREWGRLIGETLVMFLELHAQNRVLRDRLEREERRPIDATVAPPSEGAAT